MANETSVGNQMVATNTKIFIFALTCNKNGNDSIAREMKDSALKQQRRRNVLQHRVIHVAQRTQAEHLTSITFN